MWFARNVIPGPRTFTPLRVARSVFRCGSISSYESPIFQLCQHSPFALIGPVKSTFALRLSRVLYIETLSLAGGDASHGLPSTVCYSKVWRKPFFGLKESVRKTLCGTSGTLAEARTGWPCYALLTRFSNAKYMNSRQIVRFGILTLSRGCRLRYDTRDTR